MKCWLILMVSLLISGCASIRIVPKGCKTDAVYGSNPESSREVTYEEREDQKQEITASKKFTVLSDTDVKLKDLLAETGIKCEELKKLRVTIKTSWFVFREVQIKALKKNKIE